jgi:hypothetical protein
VNEAAQSDLEAVDYDLHEAMETDGRLIDTHFHFDFICARMRWKV